MEKIKIDTNAFVYPMPMTLVGSLVQGKANFMAVAWVSRVNFRPPMIAVALGPHYTRQGVEEHQVFSVNIPNLALMEKTDYCGIVSGSKTDKSALFDVFYGELPAAPLIKECPLSMACKVCEIVKLPSNTVFIGEIVEVFSEERYLKNGVLDPSIMQPFTLTMPDNTYWKIGQRVGKAWSVGKTFKNKGHATENIKHSICGMCAVRCPITVQVEAGKPVWVEGNSHDAGMGKSLCAKGGAALSQRLDTQRPKTPMIRIGQRGEGRWKRAT